MPLSSLNSTQTPRVGRWPACTLPGPPGPQKAQLESGSAVEKFPEESGDAGRAARQARGAEEKQLLTSYRLFL